MGIQEEGIIDVGGEAVMMDGIVVGSVGEDILMDGRDVVDVVDGQLRRIAQDGELEWVAKVVAGEVEVEEAHEEVDDEQELTEEVDSTVGGREDGMEADDAVMGDDAVRWWRWLGAEAGDAVE